MTDRGAVATARAVGERLADDIRRGDLADILHLPEIELPDRRAAVRETGAALQRLPDRDLGVLAEALRDLPRRVSGMEPIKVPSDSPIPDRVVDAVPFLERERSTSSWLVPAVAVVSIVGLIVVGLAMTMRRAAMRAESMARSGTSADAAVDTTSGDWTGSSVGMSSGGTWSTGGESARAWNGSTGGDASPRTGDASLAPDSGTTSLASSGMGMSPETEGGWAGDGEKQGA